jgi:phosphoribosylamine--glycine ligase
MSHEDDSAARESPRDDCVGGDPQMSEAEMKVLLVGSGGREHALAWSLSRSPRVGRIFVAPGNGGTDGEHKTENLAIGVGDIDGLLSFAKDQGIDLTVVGPENPLGDGIVDRFRAAGLRIFGPTQAAARLETSKAFAREFMARHHIPHPRFKVVDEIGAGKRAIRSLGGRCVIKADGLAAGKGVVVCDTEAEAVAALQDMLVDKSFGEAGARVLVEERCDGPEISVMAITDGERFVLLSPAQDHKRLLDGDRGPNTGGMGTYAPAQVATEAVMKQASRQVVERTLKGMRRDGEPFTGCLFCGLMLTEHGPVVIEYNARFGDPETQVQLPLVLSDLFDLLYSTADGALDPSSFSLDPVHSAACVVLASWGYPRSATTGMLVKGIADAEASDGVKVFHAGTKREGEQILTSGGRALNVVCERDSLLEAVRGVYEAIDDPDSTPGSGGVSFTDMQYRLDIAYRALT